MGPFCAGSSNLMTDKFVIAVVWNKKTWVETSLRASGSKPVLKRGQTAEIYSWRGLNSRTLKHRRNRLRNQELRRDRQP